MTRINDATRKERGLAAVIAKKRTLLGLERDDAFAARLHTSRENVNRWKRDHYKCVKWSQLQLIASVLQFDRQDAADVFAVGGG